MRRYRRWLDKASAKLIEGLRALLARPLPPTVTSAEVEIFLGEGGRGLPHAGIHFDGVNKKIDHSDPSIYPGQGLEIPLGLDTVPDFDDRYFEGEEFPGVDLQANAIKAWFAECWWKAGGWSYPLPVVVEVHDQYGDAERIILTERH